LEGERLRELRGADTPLSTTEVTESPGNLFAAIPRFEEFPHAER